MAKAVNVLIHPGNIQLASLLTGLSALAILLVLARTRLSVVSALIALVIPTVVVVLAGAETVARVGDQGDIPRGIPLPHLPDRRTNYETPISFAKVTGKAKYLEDYKADGMLYARLLLSPLPHARARNIDISAAQAMPGVKAILLPSDIPAPADIVTDLGATIKASTLGEKALTDEPVYQGEPVLAVAAVDEITALEAIEKIDIDWEPLPFNVDPLDSLRTGRPNARTQGNTWMRPETKPGQPPAAADIAEVKWTDDDFKEFGQGRLPMGKPTDEWKYGDLEAGFKKAALVLDETFVTPNTSHQTLEPRSAMAYWQNGKLYRCTARRRAPFRRSRPSPDGCISSRPML